MDLSNIKLEPLLDTLRLEKIDDAEYFSKKYSNYISNSRLGLLSPKQDGSPEKFFQGFQDQGFNPSFQLGSAVHELLLQSELFELIPDLGKPTAKMGAMADELYRTYLTREVTSTDIIKASDKINYFKNKMTPAKITEVFEKCSNYWSNRKSYEELRTSEKEPIYLDSKSIDTVTGCLESISNNSQFDKLLHPEGFMTSVISENEQAILLDVKVTCGNSKEFILKLKSKLDNYTIDKDRNEICVNDLKTLGKVLPEFEGNCTKFSYYREIAFYIYLLQYAAEKYYGIINPNIKANFLVVTTITGNYCKVFPITNKQIKQGFKEFSTLLKYVAYLIGYQDYKFNE